MSAIHLVQQIKESGGRITPIRKKLLEILVTSTKPISIPEITVLLAGSKITPNKTTVYREIEYLKAGGYVTEIELGDGKKRYELRNESCHHHLVCKQCKSIQCINLGDEVHRIVESIQTKFEFTIREHMLEFFGACKECSVKTNEL